MEGYVYLGKLYDVMGRELNISDKKIGLSKDPVSREYQLNRTKSPIGYSIIAVYKVDNMNKVERMLHAILDSRRLTGEWFKDDEDTLTGEFINFMNEYEAEVYNMQEVREVIQSTSDTRLIDVANQLGQDTTLVRSYLGVDYEVTLNKKGQLLFNGEIFDTPNKLYNNGIVKLAKGKKGNSGTNNLSQFVIKSTGERLKDVDSTQEVEFIKDDKTLTLKRFDNGMIRIFDEDNQELDTDVKSVLKEINTLNNLGVVIDNRTTQQIGKDILSLLK